LLLVAAVSVCCAFLPLADHLGYELSEAIAVCAGLFGGSLGIAAARSERSDALRAVGSSIATAIAALAVPIAIILLNGLRRPACDPLGGLVLYLVIAVPTGVLAALLGTAAASISPRGASAIVAAVFVAALAASLWPVGSGPQVFAFDHLAGIFPGPIYDEAIRPSRAWWWFRLDTMLYAGACAGAALLFGPGGRRRCGTALLLGCGAGAAALSLSAERLHWKASSALLDAELGGTFRTAHVVLHFPREKSDEERRLLATDAEVSWAAVRRFAGLPLDGAPVDAWLYRSADEKRRLIGAADTSFTKPWLRQVHTNDAPAPHPILRHELAHAAFADLVHAPFGVPGRFGGFVPEMALIEGAAVAAEWPPGEFTVDEQAAALRELKLLPDPARLFGGGLFYAESGPRAYTAAGSFIRWMWRSGGAQAFREAYSHGVPDAGALAARYEAWLAASPAPRRAVALAQQRFAAPAIVRRPCAREVAELQREAQAQLASGDASDAVRLLDRCTALEPGDPMLLVQLRRAQLRAGDARAAQQTEERALAHPKLSQPLRATLLVESGDAAWKAGDARRAAERFHAAERFVQPEPAERALRARLWALPDERRWPALRQLLADLDSGPETIAALEKLRAEEPREGLPPYLLAKQAQNRGEWQRCDDLARVALSLPLPDALFAQEGLRMLGIASWRLGDRAAAIDAFQRLGRDAPPGRRLEAERYLELISFR
jgi:hypothetical protein